jgi:hypothetical protein
MRPVGFVRAGVVGSWSVTSSTMARSVKNETVIIELINFNGEDARLIHPRCAAQAVTAGAVIARNPQTTPIRNAKSR